MRRHLAGFSTAVDTDDDIRDEYYHSHAYQTVFRSAERLENRDGEVTALLPGRAACAYIQQRAPGAEIVVRDELLPRRGVGRPAKFKDAAERRASEACRLWLRRHPGKTAQDYSSRQQRTSARMITQISMGKPKLSTSIVTPKKRP